MRYKKIKPMDTTGSYAYKVEAICNRSGVGLLPSDIIVSIIINALEMTYPVV